MKLPQVLGSTQSYTFNLPATYPLTGVFLFGRVSNSLGQQCGFGAGCGIELILREPHRQRKRHHLPTSLTCGFSNTTVTTVFGLHGDRGRQRRGRHRDADLPEHTSHTNV